jgi:serine/threonine-protein kinase
MGWLKQSGSATVAGLLALLAWSPLAAADNVADDNYAAIAYSQDSGAYGYSNNYDSRDGAEASAMRECGRDCSVVLWFRNACGALATGEDNGYGTGWAMSRGEAEDVAMSNCNDVASECSVVRWVCTSR